MPLLPPHSCVGAAAPTPPLGGLCPPNPRWWGSAPPNPPAGVAPPPQTPLTDRKSIFQYPSQRNTAILPKKMSPPKTAEGLCCRPHTPALESPNSDRNTNSGLHLPHGSTQSCCKRAVCGGNCLAFIPKSLTLKMTAHTAARYIPALSHLPLEYYYKRRELEKRAITRKPAARKQS